MRLVLPSGFNRTALAGAACFLAAGCVSNLATVDTDFPCPDVHPEVVQDSLIVRNMHEIEISGYSDRPDLTAEWRETIEALWFFSIGQEGFALRQPELTARELTTDTAVIVNMGHLTTDGVQLPFIAEAAITDQLEPILDERGSVTALVSSAPTPRHNVVDFLIADIDGTATLLGECTELWTPVLGAEIDGGTYDEATAALRSFE